MIVTAVPPAVGPLFGDYTAHRRRCNVSESAGQTSALPVAVVTVTVTAPALPAGVVAVIVVLFTTTTFVAAVRSERHRRSRREVRPRDRDRRTPAVDPLLGDDAADRRRRNVGKSAGQAPALPAIVTVTVTAPALPAGVVAVIVVLFTTTTFVAAVLPNVTVAPATKFVPVIVTAVPPAVDPLFGLTLLTVGAGPETAENVAICMTQGPAPVSVAVALLLPAVVTTLSSAISPSGEVMIRDVNPLPAAFVVVATVLAPKINSFAPSSSPLHCSPSHCSRSLPPSHPASSLPGIPESECRETPPPG